MNSSDKKTINEPVCQMALVAIDAKESLGLTANQDLETPVKLMDIEWHCSGVETPSLYQRGRQSDDPFHIS